MKQKTNKEIQTDRHIKNILGQSTPSISDLFYEHYEEILIENAATIVGKASLKTSLATQVHSTMKSSVQKSFCNMAEWAGLELEWKKAFYYEDATGMKSHTVDFYFEDVTRNIKVVIECDSKKRQEDPDTYIKEQRKQHYLEDQMHCKVFRFTSEDIWKKCETCIREVQDYIAVQKNENIAYSEKLNKQLLFV